MKPSTVQTKVQEDRHFPLTIDRSTNQLVMNHADWNFPPRNECTYDPQAG
ncbi:MAG: hypothetical protein ACTSWN_09565 [Promethearchaeota archaeon]